MTEPVVAVLDQLTPAAVEGWHMLFDLAEADAENWLLIGGQMVYLLAVENGVEPVRATDDVDVAVDVRAKPGATEWLAEWLVGEGFEMESVSAFGVGHRFVRAADPGPGRVIVDILAPDGIGERATLFTRRPARTLEAPGVSQAFERASLVTVTVAATEGVGGSRTGQVRRPSVLGALVAKAATASIPGRQTPERDVEDAALLLSILDDPIASRAVCGAKDIKRLRRLMALTDTSHVAWRRLGAGAAGRGRDALGFLIET